MFAETGRLVAFGTPGVRVLDDEGIDHVVVTLRDPAGNEFYMARHDRDTDPDGTPGDQVA